MIGHKRTTVEIGSHPRPMQIRVQSLERLTTSGLDDGQASALPRLSLHRCLLMLDRSGLTAVATGSTFVCIDLRNRLDCKKSFHRFDFSNDERKYFTVSEQIS